MDGDGDGVERPHAGRSFFWAGPRVPFGPAGQAALSLSSRPQAVGRPHHKTGRVLFPQQYYCHRSPHAGRAVLTQRQAGKGNATCLASPSPPLFICLCLYPPSIFLPSAARPADTSLVRMAVRACTYGRILRKVEYIPHPHRLGCRVGFLLSRTAYGGLASSEVSGICKDG
jgi:hypothetical protein